MKHTGLNSKNRFKVFHLDIYRNLQKNISMKFSHHLDIHGHPNLMVPLVSARNSESQWIVQGCTSLPQCCNREGLGNL